MEYRKTVRLKDGRECLLRNAVAADGEAVLAFFLLTHAQTDYLTTYPEECTYTAEQEAAYMQAKTDSPNEIEILAVLDGKIVGTAGISQIKDREKMRHRAEFGISVDKAFWGLGIGRAMMRACMDCAQKAGYAQVELEVVADNKNALALYESEGFTEYGRNPRGFRSRHSGWQELVLMRRELEH